MMFNHWLKRIGAQEDLNFLLTNRIPRKALTHFVGWLSKVESPCVYRPALWLWQQFSDLDLSEARHTQFRSLHDCFIRELKPGLRPIDPAPDILCSPCDAIVGACGSLQGVELIQAKGFPYSLVDLLGDAAWAEQYRDGTYVTLRLTSSMYHRFHAPHDLEVTEVNYISGDVWNVNPIALKRVERLFCKNERAVIKTRLTGSGQIMTLVPVAAVLVASIKLKWLGTLLHLKYRGPNVIPCNAQFNKGEEMGWFEHGSTIIVFAPPGMRLCVGIATGQRIKMGEPLLHRY
jgi:phosphatidylserine decarboxylase